MSKTVAIDLDGVLAEYHGWKGLDQIGDPVPGAIAFVHRLLDAGYDVVVNTARVREEKDRTVQQAANIVGAWLDYHGFRDNPGEQFASVTVWDEPGKPIACAYVDDRAVVVTSNPHESEWADAYLRIVELSGSAK